MSDELKRIYGKEGLSGRYFEDSTPCPLWRAQSSEDYRREVFIMTPHPGYQKKDKDGRVIKNRLPDVKIVQRDGRAIVLGCRCIAGDYRGISVFDKQVTWLGSSWVNYEIPKGTAIPEGLALTKDHFIERHSATHYTIAPKDDMPLELFLQTLKVVASKAKRI